jgi:hypothetical protein
MQARAGCVSWRSYVGLPHPVRAAPSHRVSSLLGWLSCVASVDSARCCMINLVPALLDQSNLLRYQAKEREKCGSERINNGQVFALHSGYAMLSLCQRRCAVLREYFAQIIWYTRRCPRTGHIASTFKWFKFVCPWERGADRAHMHNLVMY